MTITEQQIELDLIAKLGDLKYTYLSDIRDRTMLEANFRAKFEALNRVHLTDSEFQRLLDGIITPDVYGAAQRLRNINSFERDDGMPLNDSRPYGNILDFRQQQKPVEEAIALFSGEKIDNPREIWLVDPAPKVIDNLQTATQKLADFMQSQGAGNAPEEVANLTGDAARAQFVNLFKEVQRLKTQLDQYTDLSDEQKAQITQIVPPDKMQGFKGMYLETAKRLKQQQDRDQTPPEVQQLDFEFVLFASSVIDYDYIMGLIAKLTQQKPGKLTMNREQLIGLIQSDAKFIDEREDIAQYIRGLPVNEALDEKQIRSGFEHFKAEKKARELATMAEKHGLDVVVALQAFVDDILRRHIFDGERISELMAPLELGWKARAQKELALMEDLTPLLHKLAQGRESAGLAAYEEGR